MVVIVNRQRVRFVNGRQLRALTEAVLVELGVTAELGIHLVSERAMAQVNWDFLRHEGSTDIITFDHGSTAKHLHGELFISVADAVKHAAEFGTTWDKELVRYVIHGLLHLRGYDDLEPAKRRVMKREENRLVKWVIVQHWLKSLEEKSS
jgi:rRNA maturation RNase YbeY